MPRSAGNEPGRNSGNAVGASLRRSVSVLSSAVAAPVYERLLELPHGSRRNPTMSRHHTHTAKLLPDTIGPHNSSGGR